jgi:tRNA(fMet)-specific endonuclease VapC
MKLARKLDALQGQCAVSDITMYELYYGAAGYAEPELRMEIIAGFAGRVSTLPFTSAIARVAGQLRHKLKTKGEMIGAYDILIAATALSHDLVLMSNNMREFKRIEGLKLEGWKG